MNLIYGQIVEVFEEDGLRMGRASVRGASKVVPLDLAADAGPGDCVLLCDGVAIAKVQGANNKKENYVSGDPRQGA